MGAKLRAGVIGLGILGTQHVGMLQARAEVEVVAVADIIKARAEEVGGPLGAEAYGSYSRMLAEKSLDIVVVATPDPLHRDPVLAAIDAGVSTVIQEKPLATTVADAEAIADAAERSGAKVFVNFSNRGSGTDEATYYVIRQGLIGNVVYGSVHLDDNIVVPTKMWGDKTKEWVAGSSTAHFLLSHVVDYLHWILAPASVTEVYAITQRKVLGYTPDLYDAFLTFDSGAKIRVKAEWIKQIDGLVEFAFSFSGSEGGLFYIKRPSFGEVVGWRANLSTKVDAAALLEHQAALQSKGVNLRAIRHTPSPTSGRLSAGGGEGRSALEVYDPPMDFTRVPRAFVDAILEDTLTPSTWQGLGPLPNHVDGLRQTRVVCAIVESAETGKVVEL